MPSGPVTGSAGSADAPASAVAGFTAAAAKSDLSESFMFGSGSILSSAADSTQRRPGDFPSSGGRRASVPGSWMMRGRHVLLSTFGLPRHLGMNDNSALSVPVGIPLSRYFACRLATTGARLAERAGWPSLVFRRLLPPTFRLLGPRFPSLLLLAGAAPRFSQSRNLAQR